MSVIEVRQISNKKEREVFLHFPWKIYANDPLWVPPLITDWRERMDPQKGVFFQRGTADFFIAWRDGESVGTICAAEDFKADAERGMKECVFGFFDYIDDHDVFLSLLGTVENWAEQHGLDTIVGPYNLDYEDSYGVLLEGRDRPPVLMCGHSPEYYAGFMEGYGFESAHGDNIAIALDLTSDNPAIDQLATMADRARRHKNHIIRSADLTHWEEEIDRIHILLNKALAHLPDFREWPREVVHNSMAPFRKIVDPDLILFAEVDGQTVGWLPGIPNLNEAFIHVNGLQHPWDYARLWWLMRRQTNCLSLKSVLLLPEYWGTGVAVLMFDEMAKRARARGYKWIDASLTSLDNPRTPALAQRFGGKIYKRYRVYRKRLN
jgi:GNAT superfamily N-acetyltransferase